MPMETWCISSRASASWFQLALRPERAPGRVLVQSESLLRVRRVGGRQVAVVKVLVIDGFFELLKALSDGGRVELSVLGGPALLRTAAAVGNSGILSHSGVWLPSRPDTTGFPIAALAASPRRRIADTFTAAAMAERMREFFLTARFSPYRSAWRQSAGCARTVDASVTTADWIPSQARFRLVVIGDRRLGLRPVLTRRRRFRG